MKKKEKYYLKHKKLPILLIIDFHARLLQPIYLKEKRVSIQRKYNKTLLDKLIYSSDFLKKSRYHVKLMTAKIHKFQLPPVQLRIKFEKNLFDDL